MEEKETKPMIQDEQYYINTLLKLQQQYDELLADCKDLFSVIVNLQKGRPEPTMVQFNDPNGYPSCALDFIRDNAFWKTTSDLIKSKESLKGRAEAFVKSLLTQAYTDFYKEHCIFINEIGTESYIKGYLQGKYDALDINKRGIVYKMINTEEELYAYIDELKAKFKEDKEK